MYMYMYIYIYIYIMQDENKDNIGDMNRCRILCIKENESDSS